MQAFIEKLEMPTEAKAALLKLSPRLYVGYAEKLAREV
jgi:adenylosuccinate lyase